MIFYVIILFSLSRGVLCFSSLKGVPGRRWELEGLINGGNGDYVLINAMVHPERMTKYIYFVHLSLNLEGGLKP